MLFSWCTRQYVIKLLRYNLKSISYNGRGRLVAFCPSFSTFMNVSLAWEIVPCWRLGKVDARSRELLVGRFSGRYHRPFLATFPGHPAQLHSSRGTNMSRPCKNLRLLLTCLIPFAESDPPSPPPSFDILYQSANGLHKNPTTVTLATPLLLRNEI